MTVTQVAGEEPVEEIEEIDEQAAALALMREEKEFRQWFDDTGAGVKGQQAVGFDGMDTYLFKDMLWNYPDLLTETKERIDKGQAFAPQLAHDIFASLFRYRADILPPAGLAPIGKALRGVMEPLHETDQYKDLRGQTIGNDFLSILSTRTLAFAAIDKMDKETKQQMNRLSQQQQQAGAMGDQLAGMQQAAGEQMDATGEVDGDLQAEIDSLSNQLAQLEASMDATGQAIEQQIGQQQSKLRQAFRQAAEQATEQAEAVEDGLRAYGVGGTRDGTQMGVEDKLKLAAQLAGNDKLREVAKIAGRLKMIAARVRKSKVTQHPQEIAGIKSGSDLNHMVSSSLAMLADPRTRPLWAKQYAEGDLTIHKLKGREKTGRGPIIIAVDGSGSMAGSPDTWAKGVMLAIMQFARREKRDVAVMQFGSHYYDEKDGERKPQLKIWHFPKGIASDQAYLLDAMTFFWNGGTEFDPWMAASLKLVEDHRYGKADVICISDGMTRISPAVLAEWHRLREIKEMRAYGILIGTSYGKEILADMCGTPAHVFSIQDVSIEGADEAALGTIFAV